MEVQSYRISNAVKHSMDGIMLVLYLGLYHDVFPESQTSSQCCYYNSRWEWGNYPAHFVHGMLMNSDSTKLCVGQLVPSDTR